MTVSPRKHVAALITALIVVGVAIWAFRLLDPLFGPMTLAAQAAVWFAATFVATYLARRLIEIDVGATAVAAAASIALVLGTWAERGAQFDVEILLPVGVGWLGALLGAWVARRRSRDTHVGLRLLGAGLATLGGLIAFALVANLLTQSDGSIAVALIGVIVGALVFASAIDIHGGHCAIGSLLVVGTMTLADFGDQGAAVEVAGMLFVALLALIGGGIGDRIRRSREQKPDLPAAHVR